MLTIGCIKLDAPFFLAPMSGYTDVPMRMISRRFGCPLGMSGLLIDKMILHPRGVDQPIAALSADEHPVGAQLLGDDPETMAQAARKLRQVGYDLIDLNFSCPAPKVLRTGRGGFLLTTPERILEIARGVRGAVSCPVTMKLRIGYDSTTQSFEQFRLICRQAALIGMDALIIHGRTVEQRFHGQADWDVLAGVKREMPDIPVIGSGDLSTAEAAAEKIRSGAVDGVVIARGAIGNPWIFRELSAILAGGAKPDPPVMAELAAVMLDHFARMENLFGEHKGVVNFRKFLPGYCKRRPHRKKVLPDLMKCAHSGELIAIIRNWNTLGEMT